MTMTIEQCPRGADKPEPSCTNRHQCWEPCGELGKSAAHVRVGRESAHLAAHPSNGAAAELVAARLTEQGQDDLKRAAAYIAPSCQSEGCISVLEAERLANALLALAATPPPAPEGDARDAARWIPVSERLPDMNTPVWLLESDHIYIGERGEADSETWLWSNCYMSAYLRHDGTWASHSAEQDDDYRPTHWQPLPTVPDAALSGGGK